MDKEHRRLMYTTLPDQTHGQFQQEQHVQLLNCGEQAAAVALSVVVNVITKAVVVALAITPP
jgi:hypothetical protein